MKGNAVPINQVHGWLGTFHDNHMVTIHTAYFSAESPVDNPSLASTRIIGIIRNAL